MAHVEKIERKKGTYYRITVSSGYDINGNRIRHRMEYIPEPGMSEAKIKKAVERAAVDFERSIELGYQLNNKQTFAEYAEYVLSTKETNGMLRPTTKERYKSLMARINAAIGHMHLTEIRAQHLNDFYVSLTKNGARANADRVRSKIPLEPILRDAGFSFESLARETNVGPTTIATMVKGGKVMPQKAALVAEALEMPFKKLFEVVESEEGLNRKTILEHHRLISSILAQAEREMLVPYNAAEKAMPPKAKRKIPNYFQPEDITKILEALEDEPLQWKAMIQLFVITGARRSEIVGLKWDKLDLPRGTLIIDEGLYFTKEKGLHQAETKTGDTRFIHLPEEMVLLLRQHRYAQMELRLLNGDRWQETGYVFTRENGLPMRPDTVTQWMTNFSERHDLPHINPHAFRHSLASVLLAHGTDVVTVSKQLGHASVATTTNFYSHVITGFMTTATEKAADLFLRKPRDKLPARHSEDL